jgi:undecaprenyl-diphosphatase
MNLEWWGRFLELDERLTHKLRIAERPGWLRSMAAVLAHSGDSWLWLALLFVIWLLGNAFWKQLALILAVAILVTAALVMAVKFTIRRQRPEGEWGQMYRKTDPHSFPSGHAARAFLLAVLAVGLGPAWFGILIAVWAPLVTLSRVVMGLHYVSDILAGSLVGVVMGLVVLVLV